VAKKNMEGNHVHMQTVEDTDQIQIQNIGTWAVPWIGKSSLAASSFPKHVTADMRDEICMPSDDVPDDLCPMSSFDIEDRCSEDWKVCDCSRMSLKSCTLYSTSSSVKLFTHSFTSPDDAPSDDVPDDHCSTLHDDVFEVH